LSFAFWAVGHQRRRVAVNRQFLKKLDCSLAAAAGATSESFASGRRLRLFLPLAGPSLLKLQVIRAAAPL